MYFIINPRPLHPTQQPPLTPATAAVGFKCPKENSDRLVRDKEQE